MLFLTFTSRKILFYIGSVIDVDMDDVKGHDFLHRFFNRCNTPNISIINTIDVIEHLKRLKRKTYYIGCSWNWCNMRQITLYQL